MKERHLVLVWCGDDRTDVVLVVSRVSSGSVGSVLERGDLRLQLLERHDVLVS